MLVLALFLSADSAEMFASGHDLIPSLMALLSSCVRTADSNPAEEQQQEYDEQNRSQGTAWVVAPTSAVWPGRQQTNQENDENDESQS